MQTFIFLYLMYRADISYPDKTPKSRILKRREKACLIYFANYCAICVVKAGPKTLPQKRIVWDFSVKKNYIKTTKSIAVNSIMK